jgi:hypothetical protein
VKPRAARFGSGSPGWSSMRLPISAYRLLPQRNERRCLKVARGVVLAVALVNLSDRRGARRPRPACCDAPPRCPHLAVAAIVAVFSSLCGPGPQPRDVLS